MSSTWSASQWLALAAPLTEHPDDRHVKEYHQFLDLFDQSRLDECIAGCQLYMKTWPPLYFRVKAFILCVMATESETDAYRFYAKAVCFSTRYHYLRGLQTFDNMQESLDVDLHHLKQYLTMEYGLGAIDELEEQNADIVDKVNYSVIGSLADFEDAFPDEDQAGFEQQCADAALRRCPRLPVTEAKLISAKFEQMHQKWTELEKGVVDHND